jgi:glutathione synthase
LNGPDGPYDLKKDTSHLLLLEFYRRGHAVYVTDPAGLSVREGSVFVSCKKAAVLEGTPYFDAGRPEGKPASDFQLILMRKDPPVDAAYLQATRLLAMAPEGDLGLQRSGRPGAVERKTCHPAIPALDPADDRVGRGAGP